MDCRLGPAIGGFGAELGRRVPIVAMTVHTPPGDRQRVWPQELTPTRKPIKTAQLTKTDETLSVHSDGSNSCAEMKPTGAACRPSLPGDLRVFDADATLKRLGNDHRLFADLLEFFLEDYPILMDRLHQGLQDRDPAATALAAHSLKGLAANFDAIDVVGAAAVLEKAGRDGDFNAASESLEALEREISRLRDALLEYRHQL